MSRKWYTQREWDRVVGWGKVPKEYRKMSKHVEISLMGKDELSKRISSPTIQRI